MCISAVFNLSDLLPIKSKDDEDEGDITQSKTKYDNSFRTVKKALGYLTKIEPNTLKKVIDQCLYRRIIEHEYSEDIDELKDVFTRLCWVEGAIMSSLNEMSDKEYILDNIDAAGQFLDDMAES